MNKEIEEQIKTDYRMGKLSVICSACSREIDLQIEEVYDFGGKICEDCYFEVKNH